MSSQIATPAPQDPSLLRTSTNKQRLANTRLFGLKTRRAKQRALFDISTDIKSVFTERALFDCVPYPTLGPDIVDFSVSSESLIDNFHEDFIDRHGRIEDGY